MNFHRISLLLFLTFCSFNLKSQQNFLVIGDSHGAAQNGWVDHLMHLRPNDKFCNMSIGGNTIGFKNLNRDTLNTLLNIRSYIERGKKKLGNIDKVLILLGTNDSKSVFKDSFILSVSRFEKLIKVLKSEFRESSQPEIVFITPPPFDTDSKLTAKYKGGNERLQKLIPQLLKIVKMNNIKSIDLNKMLGKKAKKTLLMGFITTMKDTKKLHKQ